MYTRLIILTVILIWLGGCAEPAPTPQPTPLPPTPTTEAAATTPESITDVTATATAPASPTAVLETAVPETAVTPTPTPAIVETAVSPVPESLQITQPAAGAQLVAGSAVELSGRAPQGPVALALTIGPHTLITETVAVEAGLWRVQAEIPRSITGPAQVSVQAGEETAVQPVQIVPPPADATDTAISLSRPAQGETAVTGSPLFFEGVVVNSPDRTVTIGFLIDDCTEVVARQSFTLDEANASWNGYIILPQALDAEAGCAFAATGAPETPQWRETLLTLTLLTPDAESEEILLELGTPADTPFTAGQRVTLFGAAVNAPGREIMLIWYAEDGETVLVETAVAVNALNFWETTVTLPADAAGETLLELRAGEGEETAVYQTILQITP